MCLMFVLARWPKLRLPLGAISVLIVLGIFLAPNVYQAHPSSRPILREYREVKPFGGRFHYPGTVMAASGRVYELIAYAGRCYCPGFFYENLRQDVTPEHSLAEVLDEKKVTIFFANESVLADPPGADFVAHANLHRWRLLGKGQDPGQDQDRWVLLEKEDSP
jgi:hypothetical protein